MSQNRESEMAFRYHGSRHRALHIVEIRLENAYTQTFVLDGELEAEPGQFVMAWLPDLDDKPFALAEANPVTLTIAAVGPFTRALHQRQVGDFIWIRGPFGRGYQLPTTSSEHLLLIGEDYSVGALLFLARRAKAAGHQISVILSAKSTSDLTLVAGFEALDVSLQLLTGDRAEGRLRSVTEAIAGVAAAAGCEPKVIYASGSTEMLQAVAERSLSQKREVQLAWKSTIKCALGLCGTCEVGQGWLTCTDGPVFSFSPATTPTPEGVVIS